MWNFLLQGHILIVKDVHSSIATQFINIIHLVKYNYGILCCTIGDWWSWQCHAIPQHKMMANFWWQVSEQGYILFNILLKKNGQGKGENNFNVGGISEVSLHPTSSVWGKG